MRRERERRTASNGASPVSGASVAKTRRTPPPACPSFCRPRSPRSPSCVLLREGKARGSAAAQADSSGRWASPSGPRSRRHQHDTCKAHTGTKSRMLACALCPLRLLCVVDRACALCVWPRGRGGAGRSAAQQTAGRCKNQRGPDRPTCDQHAHGERDRGNNAWKR